MPLGKRIWLRQQDVQRSASCYTDPRRPLALWMGRGAGRAQLRLELDPHTGPQALPGPSCN